MAFRVVSFVHKTAVVSCSPHPVVICPRRFVGAQTYTNLGVCTNTHVRCIVSVLCTLYLQRDRPPRSLNRSTLNPKEKTNGHKQPRELVLEKYFYPQFTEKRGGITGCKTDRAHSRASHRLAKAVMRRLTVCLAVAVGAVHCPAGKAAVATVWTATKVHGEVHELVQPDNQKQTPPACLEANRTPWEDVQARGSSNTGQNPSSWHLNPHVEG